MNDKDLLNTFNNAGIRVEIMPDARHWKLFYNGTIAGFWPNTGTCYVFAKSFKARTVEALIQAFTRGRIKMPPGAVLDGASECKTCGKEIWWLEGEKDGTPTGKRIPVEETGEAHFSNCPQADQHRKPPPKAPIPKGGKYASSHRVYTALSEKTP